MQLAVIGNLSIVLTVWTSIFGRLGLLLICTQFSFFYELEHVQNVYISLKMLKLTSFQSEFTLLFTTKKLKFINPISLMQPRFLATYIMYVSTPMLQNGHLWYKFIYLVQSENPTVLWPDFMGWIFYAK